MPTDPVRELGCRRRRDLRRGDDRDRADQNVENLDAEPQA